MKQSGVYLHSDTVYTYDIYQVCRLYNTSVIEICFWLVLSSLLVLHVSVLSRWVYLIPGVCMAKQLRVNFSNNSSLGAEQQRGEKAPQQVSTYSTRYTSSHHDSSIIGHTQYILVVVMWLLSMQWCHYAGGRGGRCSPRHRHGCVYAINSMLLVCY